MAKTPKRPAAKQDKRRVAVVILGMHRSGTSALGGVLAQLGCDLPATLMSAHETNPKGFFESAAICQLNDDILASGGSGWSDWQPFNPTWFDSPRAEEFAAPAAELVHGEFAKSHLFVMKDPRICRLLPFWTGVLEAEDVRPVVVHIHRNPLDVANSLRTRDGMEEDLAQLIWLRHVLSAERDSRGLPRSFLSYDQLMQNWAGLTDRIARDLGLGWPRLSARAAADIGAFLMPALRHHLRPKEQLLENPFASEWIRKTYAILQEWAEGGENSADYPRLDQIAREFDHSAPTFAQLIETGRAAIRTVGKAETQLAEVRTELGACQKALDDGQQAHAALTEEKTQLEEAARRAEAAHLEEAEALARASQEVRVQHNTISELQSALAQRQLEAEDWMSAARAAQAALEEQQQAAQAALEEQQQAAQAQSEKALARNRTAEASVTRLTTEIAALSKILVAVENREAQQKAALQRDRDTQMAEAEAARIACDALLASTSWRVTAPLRRISRWLRPSGFG
ncbi:hypothetical protein P775_06720 [Puniceibacterium antarcticum]|uniref:Sulfotransferase domain-containing protein n=1 Tax=Puniceibacterium antarcticum TaxID=1206336 RepID=A0A2G8RHJ1_9RHOB|nr:hypothetical protein [Puniceibacterium antarcticum]PIL20953.1 hypothetical protein P775_06720 [Puniceibacterium antarcticum]